MKIKVCLHVGGEPVKEDWIEIADEKMEPLSEEEKLSAIEMNVRLWADRLLSVTWEVEESR